MGRIVTLLALLIAGAVLAACATLSQEQCQAGDWRAIGLEDGARGRPADYVANHVDACSEYGIGVDQARYAEGRADGLEAYCRLDTAQSEGLQGNRYYNVCPGAVGLGFSQVHRAALEVYEAEAELDSLESELDRLVAQLSRPDLSEDDRARLRTQLRRLETDENRAERSLRLAEQRLVSTRRQAEIALRG